MKSRAPRWSFWPTGSSLAFRSCARYGLTLPLFLSAVAGAEPPDKSGSSRGLDYEEVARREHAIEKFMENSKADVERLKARVLLRGRAYYRMVRGMPTGDFLVHASLVERQRMALLRDLDALEKLEKDRAGAEARRNQTRALRKDLEQNEQARAAMVAQKERDRAFELAFSSSRAGSSHTAVYGALSPLGFAADNFAALKGELPFPVPGRAEVQVVKKSFASGAGLEVRTSPGTPVRSIFGGRVAFADHYAEYGNTVIVDHGDNYFTVRRTFPLSKLKLARSWRAAPASELLGSRAARGSSILRFGGGPRLWNPVSGLGSKP
jgi:murein hydrolase activator